MRGPTINPTVDAVGYAQGAAVYTQSGFLLIPASVLQLVGVVVLYWYLSEERVNRLAVPALVLCLVGIGLFLPFTGGTFILNSTIGQLYEGSDTQVIQVAEATFSGPLALFLLFSSLIPYVVGYFLFGYLLWKQGGVGRVVGAAFALHAPLVTIAAAVSYYAEILGGLLLFVAGLGITWELYRAPRVPPPGRHAEPVDMKG